MLFVSCAREDRGAATKLLEELDADGIPSVIDPDLTQGDPFWRDLVGEKLRNCQVMACLDSPRADQSPWVEQEQRAFHGPKVRIALEPIARSLPDSAEPVTVESRDAMRAIRVALGRDLCGSTAKPARRPPFRPAPQSLVQSIREQQRGLEAFLRSPTDKTGKIEIGGNFALIKKGSLEIRVHALPAPHDNTLVSLAPVTNAQYRAFIDATGYPGPPTWQRAAFREDNAPVTGVTWFEATAFATWVGGSLPTQGEWIAAARGVTATRQYATLSGEIDHSLAFFAQPFGSTAAASVVTHPPSPEGYYGLCGNTWDWCASAVGPYKAIRGGGCMDAAQFCQINIGYRNAPADRDISVGFRVKTRLEGSPHWSDQKEER